ncbi:MAG: 4-alpha-glucanotransferase [OCS116 cluster bacterium]|uniref:4-alpha-glucanotransferase n=1 Tax=OCS116 cluster bacterium TaxID=2030921 RepID=A0A2A4YZ16_9PROT|nr:4-alpha-glucanotransferase [OCS116 cluster bacterium]
MSKNVPLHKLAAHYGIFSSFKDLDRNIQQTSDDTQLALLAGNGIMADNAAMINEHLAEIKAQNATRRLPQEIVITSGQINHIFNLQNVEWHAELEDGTTVSGRQDDEQNGNIILPSMPSGIHNLTVKSTSQTEKITLICAPERAPSIEALSGKQNIWGINTALYALNSKSNFGVGDFSNLSTAVGAFANQGADFVGINPVHAMGWVEDIISPYSPSHRGFLNSAYIAVPASDYTAKKPEFIDYTSHKARHQLALETAFLSYQPSRNFKAFCADGGSHLALFALYEAISEIYGSDWRSWPSDMHQASQIPPRLQMQLAPRVEFHKWLQYTADKQLSYVQQNALDNGMNMGLYLDLAVGSRRGGAETWCASDAVADHVSIGAPPDHLSPAGQNWGLTAYAPAKLKASQYKALRQALRTSMRHASMLRIDHVLGMNRSYWLPDNGAPGGYIKQPFESILAVIAIEAERAQTVVVGEDLGLVPHGFRQTMRQHGLYSYSVLQYDKDEQGEFKPHAQLNAQTLACFATHDTPTLKGFHQKIDIGWWQKLGWIADEQLNTATQQRDYEVETILTQAGQEKSNDYAGFRDGINNILATSPANMIALQADDIFEVEQAPNLPGTIDEHPNWRRRNAIEVEDFADSDKLKNVGSLMRNLGRGVTQ